MELPSARLSEGFSPLPMDIMGFRGPEMHLFQTMTLASSHEKWSLEELRLGYLQDRTPTQKLQTFFQTKVSKSFNATTTTSKKAEHLLWLAKAKKINKITLLEFQKAKQKVLRSDFLEVEELAKKNGWTGKGVGRILAVIADLFRRKIINALERTALKMHFLTTRDVKGDCPSRALAAVKTIYLKLFQKNLNESGLSPSFSKPPSSFPPSSDDGGRSCVGVILQHLSAMRNHPFAAQLKKDVLNRATAEEKKKGSGDKETVKKFLQRIGNNTEAFNELKRRAGQTLPADFLGKILFVLGRLQKCGKITAKERSELKQYYLGRSNQKLWGGNISSALLTMFAKEFSEMTGFPEAATSAATGSFVSPKKELLSAAHRIRKAGDGFIPYLLKKEALGWPPAAERNLVGKPHSSIMISLPYFLLDSVMVLSGSLPVPHPRTVPANACLIASLRYLSMLSSANRTLLKKFALKNLRFPLGSNALAYFCSHFFNQDPLVNSCGFTQDQLTEACQRAFNDLSSTSVVHVGRPVAPHTDSSPLGPVCPPGSFQAPPLMKPAAFKGFQQPVPSSVISQCGLVGPVLLKASLYVLADAMPPHMKPFIKKAVLKVFFGSALKEPTFEDIKKNLDNNAFGAEEMITTFKKALASLDPATHSFLQGKHAFAAPGGKYPSKLLGFEGSRGTTMPEMVLLVGFPGSGKSTYYKQNYSHYERINRDTLLTKERCYSAARAALKLGKSVVIDNTNPTPSIRKPYIDIAKECGAPVRAITLVVDLKVAFERNVKRFESGGAPMVPKISYLMFRKSFETPALSEGFCLVETYTNTP